MDLTLKLPEELWCRVFEYVSSLSHKFKLATVNRRFRRCITTILEKPMGLELDFGETKSGRVRLNGCAVRLDNWPVALQVLAEMTQFVSINFVGDIVLNLESEGQFLEKILTILIEADCLSEVTSLKTQSFVSCGFLARCSKLQVLDVGGAFLGGSNLAAALRKKPLTELSLRLCMYTQAMLLQLLKSPVRHKLRKVHLGLYRTLGVWDWAQLLRELGNSAWSDLEELFVEWMPRMGQLVDNDELFGALVSSLPKLSRCHVQVQMPYELNQFVLVPPLLSVLNARNRRTKLTMVYKPYLPGYAPPSLSGCELVTMSRQLQHHHPELRFDFNQDLHLTFELGNVSLCVQMGSYNTCGNVHCVSCHSFYPMVLGRLGSVALGNGHLQNYQLDRCRVGRVAADLSNSSGEGVQVTEVNQDHDLVRFRFFPNPFNSITVFSGQCFFNPCLGCLVID